MVDNIASYVHAGQLYCFLQEKQWYISDQSPYSHKMTLRIV